jgi:monofunctional biosynthetic peptidoglycan transglycosylase
VVKRLASKTKRRVTRWLLALYFALLVPAGQVGCVGLVNPPTTAPMIWRWLKGKITPGEQPPNRYHWLELEELPREFLIAVWVAEDQRFFEHWGFDWKEIQLALVEARASGRPPRGASTITQQCARSLFLWQGRSWLRKGLEAYYTVWMELLLSKQRILELYANAIELGDGVYGVETASRHYFGVPARQLSREQAALLAAILPKPREWNPQQPNERVLERQAMILKRAEHVRLPLEQVE